MTFRLGKKKNGRTFPTQENSLSKENSIKNTDFWALVMDSWATAKCLEQLGLWSQLLPGNGTGNMAWDQVDRTCSMA